MSNTQSREQELLEELELLRGKVQELETTQRKLRESEKRCRLLLASLPQKIFFKDRDSKLVSVNETYAKELGLTEEQIVGTSDYDLYPRELAEKYRKDDQKVMESRQPVTLIEKHLDGDKEYLVEVIKSPVVDDDGTVIGLMGMFSDITERKRTEEALKHERYLLHAFMANVPDCVFFKDSSANFTRINNALAKRFHLKHPDEAIGKQDSDFYAKDYAIVSEEDDRKLLETGKAIIAKEEEVRLLDGTKFWAITTKIPLRDRKDRVVGLFGVLHDITERKRAENAVRKSRRLLQAFLDNSPAVIYVKDPEGRYLLINRMYERLFGYSREEVMLKTDFDIFPADIAQTLRENDQWVVRERKSMEVEESVPHDDGVHHYMSLKFPLFDSDGELYAVCGISNDITARKAADNALRESEARKGAILDSALDCIITLDHEGRITEFNPAAEKTFGYGRSEVLNKEFAEILFPTDGDTEEDRYRLEHSVESAQGSLIGNRIESIARRANGAEFPTEMAMTHIVVDGRPIFTVYLRDITQRKKAEKELQEQAHLLREQAAQLNERNSQLSLAYAELQDAEAQLIHSEKMAAIGQLIAGLAHEINNPAAFVLTNLAVISRDVQDILKYQKACRELESLAEPIAPEKVQELARFREECSLDEAADEVETLLQSARKGMDRIRDLVATLRSYSRIDVRGQFGMGDLNEGLQATLLMLKPIIKETTQIETDLGELPLVECNLGQVNQVFMNLIANAIQAVSNPGLVHIYSRREGDGILVGVRDNGPGIPKNIRSRIFDPFFTTKEVGKGTGLGLSIARRIIDSHNGKLSFETEEGRGTEFRVWLPLRQSAVDASDDAGVDDSAGEKAPTDDEAATDEAPTPSQD